MNANTEKIAKLYRQYNIATDAIADLATLCSQDSICKIYDTILTAANAFRIELIKYLREEHAEWAQDIVNIDWMYDNYHGVLEVWKCDKNGVSIAKNENDKVEVNIYGL